MVEHPDYLKKESMSIERRLRKLEEHATPQETPAEAEERRKLIREQAEQINRSQERGEPPVFEITEAGDVFCAHDGRLVTDSHQTLAEHFFWQEVEWGSPGLVYDEEAEAFYTKSGKLAVSRDSVNLEHLMGKEREEAWGSESA